MEFRPLDVVALLEDKPVKGLLRGQVGTIVETLAPGVFEVEFSDNDGALTRAPLCRSASYCFCTTNTFTQLEIRGRDDVQ